MLPFHHVDEQALPLVFSLLASPLTHLRGLQLSRARAQCKLPDRGELAEDVALELMAPLMPPLHDLERDRLIERRTALQV